MHTHLKRAGTFILLLTLTVTVIVPGNSHALDGEDWVLVKFFEENLAKANTGNVDAMFRVAQLYERGRGTIQNTEQAIHWYQRASTGGNDYATARLGIMYYEGTDLTQDRNKALKLLQQAAAANAPSAQYYLGVMYENGDVVSASRSKAIHWYQQADKHGSYRAKSRLQALNKGYIKVGSSKTNIPVDNSRKVDLPAALRTAILDGDWQRGDRAAGFLPSRITSCTQIGKDKIRCRSSRQERNVGGNIISYVTDSTLWGFNTRDQFRIKYRNNIITNSRQGDTLLAEDDEGDYAVAANSGRPGAALGQQKTMHTLECEMEETNKLVCIKNRTMQLTFSNNSK